MAMKTIYVAVLETDDRESLQAAVRSVNFDQKSRIGFMEYAIDDGKLRMLFAAFKEGVTPTAT